MKGLSQELFLCVINTKSSKEDLISPSTFTYLHQTTFTAKNQVSESLPSTNSKLKSRNHLEIPLIKICNKGKQVHFLYKTQKFRFGKVFEYGTKIWVQLFMVLESNLCEQLMLDLNSSCSLLQPKFPEISLK